LKYWRKLVGESGSAGYVVYGDDGIWWTLVGWREVSQILPQLPG